MSYSNGPKIVMDGLTLCLDAGNPKSYFGSGTSWCDLSGYNGTGTLTNGPTFDTEKGGCISYDGADDTVSVPYQSAYSVTAMTCLMTVKTPASFTGNFRAFFSKQGADRDFNYYAYSSNGDGVINNFHISSARLSSFTSVVSIPGNLALNTWHHLGFAIGGGKVYYFLNGNIINSDGYTGTFNANNSYNLLVGSADNYWSGKIANCLFYNRVLSTNEFLQNYNAEKKRFGLS